MKKLLIALFAAAMPLVFFGSAAPAGAAEPATAICTNAIVLAPFEMDVALADGVVYTVSVPLGLPICAEWDVTEEAILVSDPGAVTCVEGGDRAAFLIVPPGNPDQTRLVRLPQDEADCPPPKGGIG